VLEETGLAVVPTRIAAVVGGASCRVRYSNGDEVEYLVTVFDCIVSGVIGPPAPDETKRLAYFDVDEMPALALAYPPEIFRRGGDTYFPKPKTGPSSMTDPEADVPYGEDFHDPAVAAAWAEGVMRKRPWRTSIFRHFVAIVRSRAISRARVLELGSGPGFLAEQLLSQCPNIGRYTLLDFSEPMLEQSRSRLASYEDRTEFLRADFKTADWPRLVTGPVDFVVSLQAVHELRHKRHAQRLYAQIDPLLAPGGEVLICDHLPAGAHTPRHRVLYMEPDEKLETLTAAGLVDAAVIWSEHDMALYRARVEARG
jgi:SAM-dependent methyltransferase